MDDILWRGFQLNDRQIYPLNGEIRSPDGTFRVRPEAVEVLICLVRQQGAIVEFGDIVKSVWCDGGGSAELLKECVSELRDHLGDSDTDQKIIKSIPDRGYQLKVPVRALSNYDDSLSKTKSSADTAPPIAAMIANLRKRRVFRSLGAYSIFVWLVVQVADTVFPPLGVPVWVMTLLVWAAALGFPVVAVLSWTLQITEKGVVADVTSDSEQTSTTMGSGRAIDFAIIGFLVLIIGFLVYERTFKEGQRTVIMTEQGEFQLPELQPELVTMNSIAILPFANLDGDPRIEYLAMGLAEDVLSLLANIRELKVPSRTSSFYFQGKDVDIVSIAKQLRVRNVLEGSIQGPVEEMKISAQLIDASSGYHVWSQSFAPRNADVLQVRDEIARSVVESLKVVLSVESQNRILRRPTSSIDAYDYYLQALSYLRRPRTEQTLDNAEGLFRRALDFDPEYALAYSGLCNVYLGKYRLKRRTEIVEPAERSCNTALTLNPELSEVHVALGSLYRHKGQYDVAEREFQRAIVKNPKLETAYYGLAMTYKAQDRLREAEDLFRYAVDLEPGYWGTHLALGNYYLEYGQPAEAIAKFRRVTELNPEYALGYNSLGAALYNSGDLAAGEAAYLKSLDIAPSEFALSNMGSVYYNSERFESAVEMFELAIDFTPDDYRNWGRLAFAQRFVPGLERAARENFQAAINLVTKTLEVNPKDWRALAYISSYYANLGDIEQSQATLEQALALGPNDPHVHYFGAVTRVALGDLEGALRFLEQASRLGYATNAIASDPDFIKLRDDESFKALLDAD